MSAHHAAAPNSMPRTSDDDVTDVHTLTAAQAEVARILGWGPRMTPRQWACVRALEALIADLSHETAPSGQRGRAEREASYVTGEIEEAS